MAGRSAMRNTARPREEALFFFHGWPSSRYQGKIMHEFALERGLRLIAPDPPRRGPFRSSSRPRLRGMAP